MQHDEFGADAPEQLKKNLEGTRSGERLMIVVTGANGQLGRAVVEGLLTRLPVHEWSSPAMKESWIRASARSRWG